MHCFCATVKTLSEKGGFKKRYSKKADKLYEIPKHLELVPADYVLTVWEDGKVQDEDDELIDIIEWSDREHFRDTAILCDVDVWSDLE